MRRRILYRATPLSFAVISFFVSLLFAQQTPPAESPPNNTFTMTTYYPAPFGAYKNLTVYDSVGLGTTSPPGWGSPLYVLGIKGTNQAQVYIEDSAPMAVGVGGKITLAGSKGPGTGARVHFASIEGFKENAVDGDYSGSLVFKTLLFGGGGNLEERMRITSSGNVGIGTTAPDSLQAYRLNNPEVSLDVSGASNSNGAGMVQVTATGTGISTFRMKNDTADWHINLNDSVTGGNAINFYHFPNFRSVMVLQPSGNVGIGTTGPNAPLDIFKSDSSATNNPGNRAIRVTATTGVNSEFLSLGYDATLNKGYIQAAQAGVAWQDLLLNPKDGNVGIGTTAPRTNLHIEFDQAYTITDAEITSGAADPASVNGIWVVNKNSSLLNGIGAGIHFGEPSHPTGEAAAGIVFRREAPDRSSLLFYTENTTLPAVRKFRMAIDPDGNVGIGTTSPSEKLHVQGNILASGTITPSDQRFKEQVTTLSDALKKIEQVRGVRFEWNKLSETLGHKSGQKDIGVIGQEIETVFPELVNTYGEEKYRTVDYGRLTAVLIEAVKELDQENKILRKEQSDLKNEVEILKKRFANQENKRMLH